MSCETASNNATAPSPGIAPGGEHLDSVGIARELGVRAIGPIDPRVPARVPGFDAPFFQAGLAGYSDAAMRIIARRHGCPFCVTEALLDRTLLAGGRGFAKADLGELHDNIPGGPEDAPLAGQIMGSDPREMAAAALKMVEQRARSEKEYRKLAYAAAGVHPSTHVSSREEEGGLRHLRLPGGEQLPPIELGVGLDECGGGSEDGGGHGLEGADARAGSRVSFQAIDVNLACPVKKIDKKARGGHWLTDPAGAVAILKAVRDAVPETTACTVKLRRSYDDTPEMARNFERIHDACIDLGYAWVTVHGRTVEQKYIGPSRWDILRDIVRRRPDAIVFGSGDIWTVHDIFRMLAYTGVHAVSVARGCIGNPWIFRQAREMLAGRRPSAPTIAEQRAVLDEHYQLLLAVCREMRHGEHAASKMIRKFGIRFAQHHPRAEDVRRRVIAVCSEADWDAVLAEFYGPEGSVGAGGGA